MFFNIQTEQESNRPAPGPCPGLPRPEASPGIAAELESRHHPVSRPRLAPEAEVPQDLAADSDRPKQGPAVPGPQGVQEAQDRGPVHRAPEEAELGSGKQDHQLAAEANGEREGRGRVEEGSGGAKVVAPSAGGA